MNLFEGSNLATLDIVVIGLYFAFIIATGLWSSRRSSRGNISGYFLASRKMHWIPVGASIFASNIGSGHFIGLAGSGAATGIGVAGFELSAIFTIMCLGWLFVPVYMSSGIYTMPEYLRKRFGGQRISVYLSFLSLLLYIFTKISADLYAGALFIQLTLNKNSTEWLYISILILLAIAALFTITGGLTAVIWTDFVQTILMILGAFILMVISFAKVGGFQQLLEKFPRAIAEKRSGNGSCGIPPKDYMNLLRSPTESDLPWTGMTFGLSVSSIWYWCADQVIVQRTLASKNMINAKGGCILASYLKLLPLWLLVFPGMIARVLFPDRVGCADPEECKAICGSPGGCTNIAYVELVIKLLPSGLSGLMLAVMLAALMSSLTSVFNSASTIFTIDVWTRFRKNPSDREMIIVGRVFVVVLVIVSVIWIPVIQNTGTSKLFDYIQIISSYLNPPISAVFLLAVFTMRVNEAGAFYGLMTGLVLGLLRFFLEFSYTAPSLCGGIEETRPLFIQMIVGNVHYLHFRCFLFLITGIVVISISLLTKPIPKGSLHRLTYWTRSSTLVNMSKTNGKTSKISKISQTSHRNSQKANNDFEMSHNGDSARMAVEDTSRVSLHPSNKSNKYCLEDANRDAQNKDQASVEAQQAKDAAAFLYEEPKWEKFVNINAIICMSITMFFWGFFA